MYRGCIWYGSGGARAGSRWAGSSLAGSRWAGSRWAEFSTGEKEATGATGGYIGGEGSKK